MSSTPPPPATSPPSLRLRSGQAGSPPRTTWAMRPRPRRRLPSRASPSTTTLAVCGWRCARRMVYTISTRITLRQAQGRPGQREPGDGRKWRGRGPAAVLPLRRGALRRRHLTDRFHVHGPAGCGPGPDALRRAVLPAGAGPLRERGERTTDKRNTR